MNRMLVNIRFIKLLSTSRRALILSLITMVCLLWLSTYIYLFTNVYPYQFNVDTTDYLSYEDYVKRNGEKLASFEGFLANNEEKMSLEMQLSSIATRNKEIIVTIATSNFQNLLMNWLCSLAALHNSKVPPLKHLLIYTVDQSFADTLAGDLGISQRHIYVDDKSGDLSASMDLKYDTKDYQMLMYYRTRFIQRVLHMGYKVLLVDHDTVWFHSPIDYIHSSGRYKNLDLVAQNDDPNPVLGLRTIICGGFLYLNNTENMKRHWDIVASQHELQLKNAHVKYTEQDILNQYRGYIKYALLPWQHYPSGSAYFSHSQHIQSAFPDVHVVHNNWVIGGDNKMNRFYSLKGFLWLLTSTSKKTKMLLHCNYKKSQ